MMALQISHPATGCQLTTVGLISDRRLPAKPVRSTVLAYDETSVLVKNQQLRADESV